MRPHLKETLTMNVCVPVGPDGQVGDGWGRAPRVAVAEIRDGSIRAWTEHDVRWDALHDVGTDGGHHARIATFLKDHGVEVVVAGHMGPPMQQMLMKMRIVARLGVTGDAREAVLAQASLER
jgi:predicted Fe-Mo cluster-binding NifX family protein